jgi:hypothetical protein
VLRYTFSPSSSCRTIPVAAVRATTIISSISLLTSMFGMRTRDVPRCSSQSARRSILRSTYKRSVCLCLQKRKDPNNLKPDAHLQSSRLELAQHLSGRSPAQPKTPDRLSRTLADSPEESSNPQLTSSPIQNQPWTDLKLNLTSAQVSASRPALCPQIILPFHALDQNLPCGFELFFSRRPVAIPAKQTSRRLR